MADKNYEILIESDSERGETWYNGRVWVLDDEGERVDDPRGTGSCDTRSEARRLAEKLAKNHAKTGNWDGKLAEIRGDVFTVMV